MSCSSACRSGNEQRGILLFICYNGDYEPFFLYLFYFTVLPYVCMIKQTQLTNLNRFPFTCCIFLILSNFFFSKDFSKLNFKHFLHGGVNVTGFDLVNTEEPNVKSFLRKWRTANQAIYPAAGHPLMVIYTVYKPPNSLIN